MIGRRAFLAGACTLATSPWVRAQPARKVFRIGILNFGDVPPAGAPPEPIVAALARLGYADGRNVEYVRRYARGQRERFQALVAEILAQEPDLVYSAGSDIARTFKTAGPRVPVVFVVSDDPVASGVVAAMNRPGGMFTGVSMMSPELSGKRLELLAAALPALARVAMLYEPDHLAAYPAEMKAATARMGIALVPLAFRVPGDFPGALDAARAAGVDAVFVEPSRFTLAYAKDLGRLAIERKLPAISAYDAFARAGGLMSYGPRLDLVAERAAAQIDRILRGAKPADIPVEQPTRVALIVNLRTARALGLTLPQPLLLRADEVIE